MRTIRSAHALSAVALVAVFAFAACTKPKTQAEASSGTTDPRVERGRYLVTVGGCNDCHTPMKVGSNGPEWDMDRMLSGHPETFPIDQLPTPGGQQWMMTAAATGTAFAGPWGVSFTANLTPDINSGIGIWTEDIFINTIRTGKHWGVSRDILPPMPWFNYRQMSDDDLRAIFAYLRSIKPVSNHVPAPLPPTAVQQASSDPARAEKGANQ